MVNAASSAKLYHELNLIEKKLRDGVRHQGMFLLLLSSWWFLFIFKTLKQTYKGCLWQIPWGTALSADAGSWSWIREDNDAVRSSEKHRTCWQV